MDGEDEKKSQIIFWLILVRKFYKWDQFIKSLTLFSLRVDISCTTYFELWASQEESWEVLGWSPPEANIEYEPVERRKKEKEINERHDGCNMES